MGTSSSDESDANLYEQLHQAGSYGLTDFGTYAVTHRMEKAYKAWGGELTTEITRSRQI